MKGAGNQQDYGMRIYDPRLGRFLSVDPITKKYPELTPYQFASNTPIAAIDMDGLEGMAGPPMGSIYAANKNLYDDLIAGENTPRVQNAQKAGGVIVLAGALALDAFVTKGYATKTLLASQVFGAMEHNRAKTLEGRYEQDKRSKELLTDAAYSWMGGKLLGVTLGGVGRLAGMVKARFNLASKVYKNAGYTEEQMLSHTKGIDLSKEVFNKTYKKGTELEQWTYLDAQGNPKLGNYYTLPGSDPRTLGIPLEGRVKTTVVLQEDTQFLQSTAADIENWTKAGEILKGGGTQLFQTGVKIDVKSTASSIRQP